MAYSQGVYTEAVYRPFQEISDPAGLARFTFPTADWLDYSEVRMRCEQLKDYALVTGTPGVLDFINGISHSRGIERVLIDIGLEDPFTSPCWRRNMNTTIRRSNARCRRRGDGSTSFKLERTWARKGGC